MIYNSDYVTNSSSTSFVLFTKNKKDFTLANFYNALKVDRKSPLAIIYKELYDLIINNMKEVPNITFEELNSNNYRFFDEFSKDGESEIKARIANGEKAFIGTISDDSVVGGLFMRNKMYLL